MIDDPIAYYVVPLIARVEATGALLAHDRRRTETDLPTP